MSRLHFFTAVIFAGLFFLLSLALDYVFFTVSIVSAATQTVLVTAAWVWCMKRWHWDKQDAG